MGREEYEIMVQGHALKKVLGYATPAVFSNGAVFRSMRHSPHQLAMNSS